MKNTIRFLIGLTLSATLLWLVFRNVHLAEMWQQMVQVKKTYVLLFFATLIVVEFCRILRWQILIKSFAQIPLSTLFRISCLGLMLILVLPLRLGEFARPYLLKKESGASMSSGMGSVVIERSIDGLLVTLLFFVTTFLLEQFYPYQVPSPLFAAALIALIIFTVSMAIVISALLAEQKVIALIRRFCKPLFPGLTSKALHLLQGFVNGLRSLPDVKALSIFIAYTLLYWSANAFGFYFVMQAFSWDVPIIAGFLTVSILVIGIMIPAGPANLGTFQGALMAGLMVFDFDATQAAAFGMIVYPMTIVVVVGFGIPYLFGRHTTSVREIISTATTQGEK